MKKSPLGLVLDALPQSTCPYPYRLNLPPLLTPVLSPCQSEYLGKRHPLDSLHEDDQDYEEDDQDCIIRQRTRKENTYLTPVSLPSPLSALLKEWVEPDLIILDDLFLARRISEHAAEVLQAIVHQRYKLRRAIVVTSNRVVQDWGRYLGDATMATTILDRLMHRCTMLEFEGKSYRLKEAAARIAIGTESS